MKITQTNKELTSYLRGFVIMTVVISHFSIWHMPVELITFANYFIAVFFILSGYGLYFSLEKNSKSNTSTLIFYVKRFARIYPLYWLYFILKLFYNGPVDLNVTLLLDFFLLHFINPPDLWFLHALIPCYVMAPLIYKTIKKTENFFLLWTVLLFVVINVLFFFLEVPLGRCLSYRGIFFNHIFLFCAGMYLPVIQEKTFTKFDWKWAAFCFFIMLYSFFQTSRFSLGFLEYQMFNRVLFSVSSIVFTYVFMSSNIQPPLFKITTKIGLYSYSIFIFDGLYKNVLKVAGIIDGRAYLNLVWYLIFFPIFFIGMVCIEECFNNRFKIKKSIKRLRQVLVLS